MVAQKLDHNVFPGRWHTDRCGSISIAGISSEAGVDRSTTHRPPPAPLTLTSLRRRPLANSLADNAFGLKKWFETIFGPVGIQFD